MRPSRLLSTSRPTRGTGYPWETLCLPGSDQPLVLHPACQFHRVVPGLGSTSAILIPEPLRILARSGSRTPATGRCRYEASLTRIVRAADAPVDGGVRVLDSQRERHADALREERFHVLHISCRASAGALVLRRRRPPGPGRHPAARRRAASSRPGRPADRVGRIAYRRRARRPGCGRRRGTQPGPRAAQPRRPHGPCNGGGGQQPVCHPPGQPLLPGAGPRPGHGRP